jgi:hypothetical protein
MNQKETKEHIAQRTWVRLTILYTTKDVLDALFVNLNTSQKASMNELRKQITNEIEEVIAEQKMEKLGVV